MWPFLAVASSLFLQSTLAQIFNSAIKGNVADTLTTLLRTPMDVGYQAYQQLSRGSYTAQQMIDWPSSTHSSHRYGQIRLKLSVFGLLHRSRVGGVLFLWSHSISDRFHGMVLLNLQYYRRTLSFKYFHLPGSLYHLMKQCLIYLLAFFCLHLKNSVALQH